MQIDIKETSKELTEHFFRTEYGKIVSVLTKYLGTENVETAEDIVQEILLKAVDHWGINGIPNNPQAWLYTTAKNLALNKIKRTSYQNEYIKNEKESTELIKDINFSDDIITDEQLKMMFICCHPSISENSQITLMLKILCGFSIKEIANAFYTSTETINKRLVRGRKQLRENNFVFELPKNIDEPLSVVLKAIYLLFNEGYKPSHKNELIRYDLCLEAIRLCEIIITTNEIDNKDECYALLSLMYLNASRFEARMNDGKSLISMEEQNRNKWNKELINKGIQYLGYGKRERVSQYLILATISALHCTAKSYEETNWGEILSLYESLLQIENSPIIRLNRSVALSKVYGNKKAIEDLLDLQKNSDISNNFLFNTTLAEFYKLENDYDNALIIYKKAIEQTSNKIDKDFIQKKIHELVPIS